MKTITLFLTITICASTSFAAPAPVSAFFPPPLLERIRHNAGQSEWGRGLREQAVTQAQPWMKMSDEQLWKLMFGATIPRSWHVFSNGTCPSCKKSVPMYDWKMDAMAHPWKVQCPHCAEFFPKNDFAAFHESGLDAHGVFDPAKADRKLLFNVDHPDAKDPLHIFGVDDGAGYVEGASRWRFIPTYVVYGQWKQVVHMGIKRLATAYLLTGDAAYARKSAIILDRVADVYPTFDFKSQGILYESVHGDGYVSVWHDATIETREMVLAYDAIKPVIHADAELAKFLAAKSEKFQTPAHKATGDDIAANIEQRILKDALANQHKIYSNYPQQFLTMAAIHTALAWPANREQVYALLDPVLEQATAVDGTTGEKGLANYSSYAAQGLAGFLGYYARMDEKFLPEMAKRHPRLLQMWRFFIDTWCADGKYYPLTGDTMHVAARMDTYVGVSFLKDHGLGSGGHLAGVLAPSMHSFLWQLYQLTKDPAFVQVMVKANDGKLDGLPYDLFAADPAAFARDVKSVLDQHGTQIALASLNKQEWHLGILRSGNGPASRAVWLDYDAGGNHGHRDGMNLGLFAKGLDLMPDLGYPPVQFGGWESQRAQWYVSTPAHNTVVVNGAEQTNAAGKTTLWAAGDGFSAISASAPELNPGVTTKFERTAALIDVSPDDAYVLDIFRVAGGHDHAKFFLSHFGTMDLKAYPERPMEEVTDYAHPQMRNFKVLRHANHAWSATWKIEDRYKLLPPGADIRLRYTDFTAAADVYTCEAWAIAGEYNTTTEAWLPRLMIRRRPMGPDHKPTTHPATPLESTFVSLIEPYDAKAGPLIKHTLRLPLAGANGAQTDSAVGLDIHLTDGRRDVILSNDSAGAVSVTDSALSTDAKLVHIRHNAAGRPTMINFCRGTSLQIGALKLRVAAPDAFVQLQLNEDLSATLLQGSPQQIQSLEWEGKPVTVKAK
jgi:hypothetical protein